MPPKKDIKGQNDKPDNTGIPKNDVAFKFIFTIQNTDIPPSCVILYEWMTGGEKYERYDTGLVESWQRKQKTLIFEKQHETLRVDDKKEFCKSLSSHKFYIYFVNPQTSQLEDQLSLDYSSLLWAKIGQSVPFEFKSETIKVNNIDGFSMKLQADKELMQQMYWEYLNPMMVEVIGAMNSPFDNSTKYLPSYVKYKFFDNTVVQTQAIYGQGKLIWQHKHVFLAGLMNSQQLRQKIRSSYLRFQFHDRDQVKDNKLKEDIELVDIAKAIAEELEKDNPIEEDPKKKGQTKKQPQKKQAKKQIKKDTKKKDTKIPEPILPLPIQTVNTNYGLAVFSLVQFLKPSVRAAKYKSPVIPRVMFEDFQSKNIDLNTTARNQMQKVLFSNNYFDHDTTIVIGFSLASDIGGFVKKNLSQIQSNDTQAIKVDDKLKARLDNFERVVVFLPYKDKQNIQKLQHIFYQSNMAAFGLKNKRQLTTYLLKNQQKTSTTFDYLSGLQIIDPEGRVYIIEGLKGKSIHKIYDALPKEIFNTSKQKILKNTSILFTNRIYADFNIDLKRIRLRPSLSQILLDPSIYIKSKVDEKICENLNKLSELRIICDDLQTVVAMNLWPQTQTLIQIQRKYSQSLTYEDIHGQKEQKKQRMNGTETLKEQQKTIEFLQQQGNQFKTADGFFNTKSQEPQQDNDQTINQHNNTTTKKNVHTKTFIRDKPMKQTYNFHFTSMPAQQKQPVYIYASQKLNWYQKQNQQLRQRMQKDKNKIYTMSMDYLSLSIDPYVLQLEAKKELQLSKTKNYSPQKFSSLLVRTKQQRMKIAKQPGAEDIADMIRYPYHEQKQREIQMRKSQRDNPPSNGKGDFKKYLKGTNIFSQPDVLEIQKMARVEQQRLLKQEKRRRQEEERKKLLGDPYIKTKKGYCSDKVTNLDKFTSILEGEPAKKGIIDISKKSKQKRPVQNYEVSLYLKEKINNPKWNPLVRVDDESKNVADHEFNYYQKPQFLTQTGIYKPLKNN